MTAPASWAHVPFGVTAAELERATLTLTALAHHATTFPTAGPFDAAVCRRAATELLLAPDVLNR